jgi:hypothetical protein
VLKRRSHGHSNPRRRGKPTVTATPTTTRPT